jgi:hypothetical protein
MPLSSAQIIRFINQSMERQGFMQGAALTDIKVSSDLLPLQGHISARQ